MRSDTMNACRWALSLMAVALAYGCAGVTPYRSTGDKNFEIRTHLDENVRATVDVYNVDAACRARHEGTIVLDSPRTLVGIPSERRSVLVFGFKSSEWLGSRTNLIAREALLRPRAGRRYEVDLTYRNDIYNVVVHERKPGRPGAIEMQLEDFETCR